MLGSKEVWCAVGGIITKVLGELRRLKGSGRSKEIAESNKRIHYARIVHTAGAGHRRTF